MTRRFLDGPEGAREPGAKGRRQDVWILHWCGLFDWARGGGAPRPALLRSPRRLAWAAPRRTLLLPPRTRSPRHHTRPGEGDSLGHSRPQRGGLGFARRGTGY